jgi:hypothetical protein
MKQDSIIRLLTRLTIGLAAIMIESAGFAATMMWTNVNGGNWSDAINWSPNQVPGAGDSATIAASGSYIVTVDQDTTVLKFTLGNTNDGLQNLQVAGGVTLTTTGLSTVFGNTSSGTGSLTILGGGNLNLGGSLFLYGPATNAGAINLTNTFIYLYNDGTATLQGGLINQGGALITLNGSGGIMSQTGPNDYFINNGTVTATGPGLNRITASIGVLEGIYNAASGATNRLGGGTASAPLQADSSFTLNGPGLYQFYTGYLFCPTNIIPNLTDMIGGTLLLGPGFQGGSITNLTLDGINLTNNLPLTGTLTTTFGSISGTLVVSNGAVLSLNATTLNAQTVVQSGGQILISGGAPAGNASILLAGTLAMNIGTVGGTIVITNGGLLSANNSVLYAQVTVQAGGKFLTAGGGNVTLVGSGPETNVWMNVLSGGELDINLSLELYGPLTNSGVINITNFALFCYNQLGNPRYTGGIVNQSTGVINFWPNGGLYGTQYGNEYVINQGTINLMKTSSPGPGLVTINVSCFTNQAVMSAQGGTIMLQSAHLGLQPSETLQVGLNSRTDFGRINITGTAPITGTFIVNLNNGYIPSTGTSNAVINYGSSSGSFTGFSFPDLSPKRVWQPIYGGTFMAVVVRPETSFPVSGTSFAYNINGIPGQQAVLLTSTNITAPRSSWTPVRTNTIDLTTFLSVTNNIDPSIPWQFFSFKFQ